VSLDEALVVSQERGEDVVGVDEALKALAAIIGDKKRAVGQWKNPNRSNPYRLFLRV